jgi:uncharacterized phage protein gp47/JayE
MAGLTPTGFESKTFETIRGEINASLYAKFGPSIDLSDESWLGGVVAIMSELEALLWEIAEATYAAGDPDSTTDDAQDKLCAITGTVRRPARSTTATLTLVGTAATSVTAGSRAATDLDDEFATLEDTTITLVSTWQDTTAYALGARRRNDGNVYQVTVAGTSAGSGGPTGTGTAIVDGTVTWRFLGAGDGAVDVAAAAVETGPLVVPAFVIDEIVTPVSGWNVVTNLLDAETGALIETDEDLRVRREQEIAGPGTAPLDSIRANLLGIPGVTIVNMFQNVSDVTDADGIPPHAVEALVVGGDDQAIFDTLLASVAAGIATHGTETGSALDSEGNSHVMKFSRPEDFDLYIAITLVKDPDGYPEDGDDQIKAAIVAWGDSRPIGYDAHDSAISAQAFAVDGVLDVTSAFVDFEAPANGASFVVTNRQRLIYDTSRIVVNTSDGTP